ncbi:MAG: NrtA/SsuA/CpmA family ABC transporter substrate-binding protein [Peptococcaceae bacterium]|nr:NrtA/SsuA/CpmA family ABC transporter substrate-binding protein [Peptococcaceae bacterium]
MVGKVWRLRILIVICVLTAICLGTNLGCVHNKDEKARRDAGVITELHVSYASRPINVPSIVAIQKKFFEERFAEQGISIVWHELAGTEITEALASGAIDIATSLNAPSAIIAKAAGHDIKIIAGFSRFPEAIALVAARGSSVKSVAELKGKRVAVTKGTMLHEMLVKVLKEEDLGPDDAEMFHMESPEALTALLGGQIDAAVLPEPLLSKALASDKGVQLKTAQGVISGQTVMAAKGGFLEKHADVVKIFLEIHEACLEYIAAHEEEALLLSAAVVDMSVDQVRSLYPKFEFVIQLQEVDIQAMKESAIFLQGQGIIEGAISADTLIEDLIDLSYWGF